MKGQACCNRLRRCGLSIAREPSGRREIGGAMDAIDARALASALHLDIANDEKPLHTAVLARQQ